MFTQWGYGLEWPNQFGTSGNDWTSSTLKKECKKAKCVWWQHPENNCPDKLATQSNPIACTNKDQCQGTCAEPNCDCVEWYHQVIILSCTARQPDVTGRGITKIDLLIRSLKGVFNILGCND